MRGISGSTTASIVINIIQLTALVVFSVLAIMFRVQNPLGVAPAVVFHRTLKERWIANIATGR